MITGCDLSRSLINQSKPKLYTELWPARASTSIQKLDQNWTVRATRVLES
jgi:hypothetical protein